MKTFQGKNGPLLIAEIGGNHEGNFEYAKKLTELAVKTQADYIKFQLYSGDTLVSSMESPQRNQHFKKFELSQQEYISLAELVVSGKCGYMASVWDTEYMSWIDKYMKIYKIGSGDLTAYPLLRHIALIGKPIVLSTGLSTEEEVLDAVNFIQGVNPVYNDPNYIALLQCTSMYPIEHSDANLAVMKRLKELTGLTVGYSDHTEGYKTLAYAYAMGAEVLEFHFTDTKEGKVFRDHKVSLTPTEVDLLIEELKFINLIKGDRIKKPLPIEVENGHIESFRRAVYPKVDIKKGSEFTEENLTVLRPNHGIDARKYFEIIGKKASGNLKYHQKLDEKDII